MIVVLAQKQPLAVLGVHGKVHSGLSQGQNAGRGAVRMGPYLLIGSQRHLRHRTATGRRDTGTAVVSGPSVEAREGGHRVPGRHSPLRFSISVSGREWRRERRFEKAPQDSEKNVGIAEERVA